MHREAKHALGIQTEWQWKPQSVDFIDKTVPEVLWEKMLADTQQSIWISHHWSIAANHQCDRGPLNLSQCEHLSQGLSSPLRRGTELLENRGLAWKGAMVWGFISAERSSRLLMILYNPWKGFITHRLICTHKHNIYSKTFDSILLTVKHRWFVVSKVPTGKPVCFDFVTAGYNNDLDKLIPEG